MCLCYLTKRRTVLQSVQKVEHQAPHRDNRFTTEQRDSKRARETSTQREQPREEKRNNDTDPQKQKHNKRTRQDKRITDC